MFSNSEIVSWKKSSQIKFDLLSVRNFTLCLLHSLAGEFGVRVKVLFTILAHLKTFKISVICRVPLMCLVNLQFVSLLSTGRYYGNVTIIL